MGDDKERLNRELTELINELRVVIPGVTVVFAFLLTVPFASGFGDLPDLQRGVYFVLFLLTLGSMTCLMAPSAHHRLKFRTQERGKLLPWWNGVAIVGLILLFLAFTTAAFLATSMMFSDKSALLVSGLFLIVGSLLWFLIPFGVGSKRTPGG